MWLAPLPWQQAFERRWYFFSFVRKKSWAPRSEIIHQACTVSQGRGSFPGFSASKVWLNHYNSQLGLGLRRAIFPSSEEFKYLPSSSIPHFQTIINLGVLWFHFEHQLKKLNFRKDKLNLWLKNKAQLLSAWSTSFARWIRTCTQPFQVHFSLNSYLRACFPRSLAASQSHNSGDFVFKCLVRTSCNPLYYIWECCSFFPV